MTNLSKLFFIVLVTVIFSSANARDVTGVTVSWAPHYGTELENEGALSVITKEAFQTRRS